VFSSDVKLGFNGGGLEQLFGSFEALKLLIWIRAVVANLFEPWHISKVSHYQNSEQRAVYDILKQH
jgi:hypothetical protein